MKNFSKKLSFVMATAMVVTSLYAPQGAEAAATNKIVVAKGKKAVKSKNIYIGGKTVNFDAIIKGKNVKSGTWSSSNKKVASVDKNGVVKALKNGKVTISFKTKATKKAKSVTVKMTINARTRASKMTLTPAAVTVKEGASADVAVSYELSKKIQAAGGKTTTYKLFAESSDEKVATVSVDGNNKVTVKGVAKSATPVSITVYAAQVTSLAKAKEVKFKLTEKFDVKVTANLEAKQTGANKITVMGSDFVASKSAFVVKNSSGVVLPLKDMVKVNEAKTEAVLEGDTAQIPVGKYTLSYNNSDPVEFEVVKAAVKRIEIVPTNTAIMVTSQKAIAYYKVYNQFDEEITKSPLAANVRVSGSDGAGTNPAARGEIKFENSVGYQLNLSKVSVSVVDTETGVNATAFLTVGEQSKLWEAEYKGLFNTTTRKVVESISDGDKLANFAVIYTAKDQYGLDFTDERAIKKNNQLNVQLQVNAISVTGLMLDAPKIVSVNDDSYIAFPLKNATSSEKTASRPGEVTLQGVVINNGKQVGSKFNVVSSTKVDSLTVRPSATGVYEGQENWLDFTALDANGKEVTSWDSLKALNDPQYMKNANVRFAKKDDGKVGLLYTPGTVGASNTVSVTQVLTFVTQTNKFTTATIPVRAKRVPSTILGVASDAVRGTTGGQTLTIKGSKIRFQDQYGNNMTADEVKNAGNYKIQVTLANETTPLANSFKHASTTGAVNTVDLDGGSTKVIELVATGSAVSNAATGVSKVTLSLLNNSGVKVDSSEDKTFEVYNTKLQDMSSFAIEDPGLKAAKNLTPVLDNSNLGFKPSVVGYYAGQKISLANGTDFTVYTNSTVASEAAFAPVPSVNDDKDFAVKKTIARVIINDDKGTVVEREFSYSLEGRKVNKVEMDSTTVTGASAAVLNWNNIKSSFKVKDQYDAESTVEPYITYSDVDDMEHTVTDNGKRTAAFKMPTGAAGTKKTVTIKLAFPGSNYVFEKVITFKVQ